MKKEVNVGDILKKVRKLKYPKSITTPCEFASLNNNLKSEK